MANIDPAATDTDNQPEEAVEDVSRGCFGYGVFLLFFGAAALIIKIFI